MEDHLRFAIAYWHSFAWPGGDPFGGQTFERPWFGDTMELARGSRPTSPSRCSRSSAFPSSASTTPTCARRARPSRRARRGSTRSPTISPRRWKQTGVKLLWGTANLFSHRRFMAGAATNPDPDVFAYAAATVKACIDVTKRLGGANYVLWGGREGYETLLNTDLKRERSRPAASCRWSSTTSTASASRHDPDRAEAAGADQAPVRLRRRDRLRLPQGLRAGEGGQGQHRAGPRDPRRPFLRARDGAGRLARHLRLDRHEPQRLPVGLGHRPVPEQRAGDGARLLRGAARRRLHHRRHQLRRQAPPPVARSGRPDPRPCRRDGHLRARLQGGGGDDRGRHARTPPGRALCRLGS
jgi:hypothetical protein